MQRQTKGCEDGFNDFPGIDIHARASHVRSIGSRVVLPSRRVKGDRKNYENETDRRSNNEPNSRRLLTGKL